MSFQTEYKKILSRLDATLTDCVPIGLPERLSESMRYSLLGGGKRLRPVLFLSTVSVYGKTPSDNDYLCACALECIHTYSLIHDDLPSMDNDDVRRGNPTNHIVYGEATAVLAGDALLNLAFELLARACACDAKYVGVLSEFARDSGALGMVGGQAMEFEQETDVDAVRLNKINSLKTGKLIEAAFVGGAIAADRACDIEKWRAIARSFGAAFQLCDDLLDSDTDERSLVAVLGTDRAKEELLRLEIETEELLDGIDGDTEFPKSIASAFLLRVTDGL